MQNTEVVRLLLMCSIRFPSFITFCMCVFVCLCLSLCVCVCVFVCVCMCFVYFYIFICLHAHMPICLYVYMYMSMNKSIFICLCSHLDDVLIPSQHGNGGVSSSFITFLLVVKHMPLIIPIAHSPTACVH